MLKSAIICFILCNELFPPRPAFLAFSRVLFWDDMIMSMEKPIESLQESLAWLNSLDDSAFDMSIHYHIVQARTSLRILLGDIVEPEPYKEPYILLHGFSKYCPVTANNPGEHAVLEGMN